MCPPNFKIVATTSLQNSPSDNTNPNGSTPDLYRGTRPSPRDLIPPHPFPSFQISRNRNDVVFRVGGEFLQRAIPFRRAVLDGNPRAFDDGGFRYLVCLCAGGQSSWEPATCDGLRYTRPRPSCLSLSLVPTRPPASTYIRISSPIADRGIMNMDTQIADSDSLRRSSLTARAISLVVLPPSWPSSFSTARRSSLSAPRPSTSLASSSVPSVCRTPTPHRRTRPGKRRIL